MGRYQALFVNAAESGHDCDGVCVLELLDQFVLVLQLTPRKFYKFVSQCQKNKININEKQGVVCVLEKILVVSFVLHFI